MPIVDVQGQEIEFPDDMAPEAIQSVLREKFPPTAPVAQGDRYTQAGNAVEQRMADSTQLRPKFQDPIELAQAPANNSLAGLFASGVDTMRANVADSVGNIKEGIAGRIDNGQNMLRGLGYEIFGQPEVPADIPRDVLSAPQSNIISNSLRDSADEDFYTSNAMRAVQDARNSNPSVPYSAVKENPFSADTLRFVAEQGASSLPSMAAALVPYIGLPAVGLSTTQQVAEQNAINQGRTAQDAGGGELLDAAPFGIVSSLLEKVGAKGSTGQLGKAVEKVAERSLGKSAKHVAESAGEEAVTEGVQNAVEQEGGIYNTDKKLTAQERIDNSLSAALVGAGMGGTVRASVETGGAAKDAIKAKIKPELSVPNLDVNDTNVADIPETPVKQSDNTAKQPDNMVTQEVKIQTKPVQPEPVVTQEPKKQTTVTPLEPAPVAAEPVVPNEQPAVQKKQKVITPTGNQEIDTEYEVVDAKDLVSSDNENFPLEDVQPRDRDRKASQLQIDDIVRQGLDPEQVHESRTTNTGAPIIGMDDNVVESGNGRVMAIKRSATENPEAYAKYKEYLTSKGYDISGKETPVLVRRRKTAFTPEQRRQFAIDSNEKNELSLSTTERAKADAKAISDDDMAMFAGGDVGDSHNHGFVQRLIGKVISKNDRNNVMSTDGTLSQDGLKRLRSAILAKAYDSTDIVQKLMENTDNNIRGIGNALLSVSGNFAKLTSEIARGNVPKNLDIRKNILDASNLVSEARNKNEKIETLLKQDSMFEGAVNPITEKVVRAFYNEGLGRAASQQKIEQVLKFYTEEAAKAKEGNDLLGLPSATPEEILDLALSRRADDKLGNQPTLALADKTPVQTAEKEQSKPVIAEKTAKPKVVKETKEFKESEKTTELFDSADGTIEESTLEEEDQKDGDKTPPVKGGADPSSNQRSFIQQAFTSRPSMFRKIFRDAGFDPKTAVNYSPERQFKIMSKALKDKFDITPQMAPGMPIGKALDQISDLYKNLETMAYVLGLPAKSMGLAKIYGKKRVASLTLLMSKKAPYLGVFKPAQNIIGLPGRSNSFAHEWMHALDFFVHSQLGTGKYEGISGQIRKAGLEYQPNTTEEAWVNVMQNIFFDQGALAAEVMSLETQLEQTKAKGAKEAITKKLDALKAGNSKMKEGRSEFYRKAAKLDGDYWKKPTEMLARSFEAYIAEKVTLAGGKEATAAISKTDDGYMSSAEERFVQTFPREEDRLNIFQAYDMLFDRMRESDLLNKAGDQPVTKIEKDLDMVDPSNWDHEAITPIEEKGLKGIIATTVRSFKEHLAENRALSARPKNPRSITKSLANLSASIFSSMQAMARMMERRYKNSQSLRKLNDMYFKRTGSNIAVKETYREEIEALSGKYKNRINNILRDNGIKKLDKDTTDKLYEVMTTPREANIQAPSNIKKAGGELRAIMNDLWQHGDNAGLDIGFVKNQAYLQRLMDFSSVMTNQDGFQQAATEAKQVQFDYDVGTAGKVNLDAFMDAVKYANAKSDEFGRARPFASKGKGANDLMKQFRKLYNEFAQAEEEQEREEAMKKVQDFLASSGLLDDARQSTSELGAESWLGKILGGGSATLNSMPSKESFTKSRMLQPEASAKLQDFYVTDPVELVGQYAEEMIREAAFARREEETNKMFAQLAKEGVDKADIEKIQTMINVLTGRHKNRFFNDYRTALAYAHMFGTIVLLGRSVISSLSEPITYAVRTGRTRDAFRGMLLTISDSIKTEDRKTRGDIAAFLGLVAQDMTGSGLDSRFGGSFSDDPERVKLYTSRFFRRSGLTGLTNAQRRAGIAIGNAYMRYLSKKVLESKVPQRYLNEMAELGIPQNKGVEFAKWLTNMEGYPTIKEMENTPFGEMYGLGIRRVNYEGVQNPTAEQRPLMAANPVGRMVLSVTSFLFGFWENISKGTIKRVARVAKDEGALAAAEVAFTRYLAPIALLWVAQSMIIAARTALMNPDRWEEWEKSQEGLEQKVALAGLSSMGITGPADTLVNAATGIRYQRDLANVFTGAYAGFYLQQLQRILQPLFGLNSEKTNTGEYGMVKAAYQGIAAPSIAMGLSWLPGGGILTPMYGAANMYLTSDAAAGHLAEAVVGEKGAKTTGNYKASEE